MTAHQTGSPEVIQAVTRKILRLKSSDEGEGTFNNVSRDSSEGGVRKKQIFQGIVRNVMAIKLNILIIAEFWPSVIVGIETNKSNKLWICCKHIPNSVQVIFPDGIIWVDEAEVAKLIKVDELDVLIIQSSGQFCEQVLSTFGRGIERKKLFVILPASRIRRLSQVKLMIGKWF